MHPFIHILGSVCFHHYISLYKHYLLVQAKSHHVDFIIIWFSHTIIIFDLAQTSRQREPSVNDWQKELKKMLVRTDRTHILRTSYAICIIYMFFPVLCWSRFSNNSIFSSVSSPFNSAICLGVSCCAKPGASYSFFTVYGCWCPEFCKQFQKFSAIFGLKLLCKAL